LNYSLRKKQQNLKDILLLFLAVFKEFLIECRKCIPTLYFEAKAVKS